MQPGILDHVFVAALIVLMPLIGVLEMAYLNRSVAAGRTDARSRLYRHIAIMEWGIAAVATLVWVVGDRTIADLGLHITGGRGAWIVLGIGILAIAGLVMQNFVISRSPERLAAVRNQLGAMESFVPHDRDEARMFNALSLTAGICEEIIYRGFVIGYLAMMMHPWAAMPIAAVIFGLAHVYQGAGGAARSTFVGLILGSLYVASGSLLVPIVLHAAIDVSSGLIIRQALEAAPPVSPQVDQAV